MERNEILLTSLLTYFKARNIHFSTQYELLNRLSRHIPGLRPPHSHDGLAPRELLKRMRDELFTSDAENILAGIYPLTVLMPEFPVQHLARVPSLLLDGLTLYRRRATHTTVKFSRKIMPTLGDLPEYYRRNFHFQTDGYLSRKSAGLYDHQVELLFGGTADSMRRMLIKPMRDHFKGNPDGAGLRFLEMGAGTGRATRFVKLAFPKARIVVSDLSEAYLAQARENLKMFDGLDYFKMDAAEIPFGDQRFDAVFSVFTLHEIPSEIRIKFFSEAFRTLKSSGLLAIVDTAQLGDVPGLNPVFQNFPKDFHEPFYVSYVKDPLENILKSQDFRGIESRIGYLSKVTWAMPGSSTGTGAHAHAHAKTSARPRTKFRARAKNRANTRARKTSSPSNHF